jgi:hypothetical protein
MQTRNEMTHTTRADRHLLVMQDDELVHVNECQPSMTAGVSPDTVMVCPPLVCVTEIFEIVADSLSAL